MHVAVDFRFFVPIEVFILSQLLALAEDIHEFPAPAVPAFIRGQTIEQSPVRGFLQIHIERRVYAQAAFVNLVTAILRLQVAPDFFDVVRRQRIRIFLQVEHNRLALRIRRLSSRDLAVLEHGIEHQVAPFEGAVRMCNWRIVLRSLGKSRQQRRFLELQSLGWLAEIKFRRGLVSISPMPQKYLISVERKDLRLGETALDLDGEQRLLYLAIERTVGRKKQIAGELHGERGCSLNLPARFDVTVGGACDAPDVDARMPVEIFVFDRDQRVAENLRIILVRGNDAALQCERADDSSLPIVEFRDRTGTIAFEFLYLRQIRRIDQQKPAPSTHHDGKEDKQRKHDEANELSSASFYRRNRSVIEIRCQGFEDSSLMLAQKRNRPPKRAILEALKLCHSES